MSTHPFKRSLATLVVIALVAPMLAFPHKASAQWITFDLPNSIFQSITSVSAVSSDVSNMTTAAATGVSAGADVEDLFQNWVLRPLAIALAKTAIQSITESTVNWINGGFDGSPAFVTDLQKNFRQLGDGVAQKFLTELAQSTKINSPYLDSLITNVGTAYYLYSSKDALAARLQDTLSKSSQNPDAFRAGNFQEGGWDAWFESFANPANNPIGANMIASQALAERVNAAIVTRASELSYGKGFLSWRGDCVQADISAAQQAAAGQTAEDAANTATIANLSDAEGCTDREIITPGSFIENKLNITTDSPLRQLELAQSIDAIVGALAQQLISKALGGGGGLRGVSQPAQGGGSSTNTNATSGTSATVVTTQQALATTIQTNIKQVTAWKEDSQTILTVATAAKAKCANNPGELADPVNPAYETSSAAVEKATSLLASLNELLAKLQTSTTSSEALSQSGYLEVSSAYQALDIPTTTVMTQAARDAEDSGTSVVPTLYTKLNALATSNCVPFDPKNP